MIIHNVTDRRHDWIGSWEVETLTPYELINKLKTGATVIYRDSAGKAEAGTVSSWNARRVWANFGKGSTAAACDPADLFMAIRTLDGKSDR